MPEQFEDDRCPSGRGDPVSEGAVLAPFMATDRAEEWISPGPTPPELVEACVVGTDPVHGALLVPLDGLALLGPGDIDLAECDGDSPSPSAVARCGLAFVAPVAEVGSWSAHGQLGAGDLDRVRQTVQGCFTRGATEPTGDDEELAEWLEEIRRYADAMTPNRRRVVREWLDARSG